MITFILILSLTMIIASVAYLSSASVKDAGNLLNRGRAFCLADGAIQKAIWYLKTPVAQGGKGQAWRTSSYNENFGGGSFNLKVTSNSEANIMISAEGDFKGTKRPVSIVSYQYPAAFDYGIFSVSPLSIGNNTAVSGNVLCYNDVTVNSGASVTNGTVAVDSGHTINGGGSWTQGVMPTPVPSFPAFDTSYYDGLINTAKTSGSYTTSSFFLNMNGGTYYYRTNISIWWLIGPGTLVAGNNIYLQNVSGNGLKLICYNDLNIPDGCSIGSDGLLFAGRNINFSTNSTYGIFGSSLSVLAPNGTINIGNNWGMSGIMHGRNLIFNNNDNFAGSVLSGSAGTTTLGQNCSFTYDRTRFPGVIPTGLTGRYGMIEDSWKEQL